MSLLSARVGCFNPRFSGYRYAHMEWTRRFVGDGHGGLRRRGGRLSCLSMGQGVVYLAGDSRRDHDAIARNASVKAALGGVGDDVPKPWLEAGRRAFWLPLCAGGAIRRFRRLNSSAESALQLVCSRLKAVLLAVMLVQDLQ